MRTEDLGNSKLLNLLFRPAGAMMGSKLRERLFDPVRTLRGAGIEAGETVLEVGCGTGFFTIPAARMIGDRGRLIALDVSAGFLERVARKVESAGLGNVCIVKRDALDTGLEAGSIDRVLLLGVVPFPLLPLKRLLPEMHRVLKPEGGLAVWLFPPLVHAWVPRAIVASGLFAPTDRRGGVHSYRRS